MAKAMTFQDRRRILPALEASPSEVQRRLDQAAANCAAATALHERTEACLAATEQLRGAA